jgi:hypothetical protein
MSRRIQRTLASLLVLALPALVRAAPPPGWAKLQDIPVFTGAENPTGWAGGDGLEVPNGYQLPIDDVVTHDGRPSLRIRVTNDPSWWWVAMLVWRSWGTLSLEPYAPDGALELSVKGAVGGERFQVVLEDRAYERYVNGALKESQPGPTVPISNYATVTTEWQTVRIPLRDLLDPATDLRSAWVLRLVNGQTTPMTVWIADIKFTSPADEPSFPAVKVNQVGYLPVGEKHALVSGFDGKLSAAAGTPFAVKRASDGRVFWRGRLALLSDYDPRISGERVLLADFSGLVVPGTYVLSVEAPGMADSPPFRVAFDAYSKLLVDASRYFYFQRANMPLDAAFAGGFARADLTPIDFAAPFQSGAAPARDVSGGWYDAGDFGKYVSAGGSAISDLLWAYELVPFVFKDGQLGIPESGNGVPDLLDEVKYELDFLLRMQDADGGFFSRVFETNPRQISDVAGGASLVKPTPHTGSAAAALAHASIVFRRIDPAYADALLAAARRGWDYLEAHPEFIRTPDGPYSDWGDLDDRFWAAATLFRATGEARYDAFVHANYQAFANDLQNPENAHGVGSMQLIGYLQYARARGADRAIVAWTRTNFRAWASVQVGRFRTDPWRNTLHDNYYWGSNYSALTDSVFLVAGGLILREANADTYRVLQSNLNYVLGVNPLALSYVTGHGARSLTRPFSGIYSFDGKPGVPPGYMAGGANQYEGAWYSRFHGKCHVDVDTEWTTNEHTIYWNASLVFSAAVLSAGQSLFQ